MKNTFLIIGLVFYVNIFVFSQEELNFDIYFNADNGPGEMEKDNACFWKNGETVQLKPVGSRSSDLFVNNNNIYVSGHFQNKSGNTSGCYWKNGIRTDLFSVDNDYSKETIQILNIYEDPDYIILTKDYNLFPHKIFINDLFTDKEKIYITGTSDDKAFLWENGSKIDLNNFNISTASSVGIFNDKDIFIVGQNKEDVFLLINYKIYNTYKIIDIKPGKSQVIKR